MSFRPAPYPAQPPPADRRELLFTPGLRLGWVFRDRRELAVPYPEPGPSQQLIQGQVVAEVAAAEQALAWTWRWAGRPSLVLAAILALVGGCAASAWDGPNIKESAFTLVVLCGPGLLYTSWRWWALGQARARATGGDYEQAVAAWSQRAAAHEATEMARLGSLPEWGSVTSPASRTDIFGGTLADWQALLTVHGASILAERQLLAVDLTGQHATAMLTSAASATQVDSATHYLPQDLARCGLLAELSPAHLADAIVEAMHAGNPAGGRTDRAVDVWIVQQLAGALTRGTVTPRRLAAAARAALGHPIPDGLLNPAECEHIAGGLFPAGYRQEITGNLVRLDAVLAALAVGGSDGWPSQPSRCTCLAMDTAAPSSSEEILRSLIIAWLTVHVTTSAGNAPAVIIAGADTIARPHLERLADACERRGVPLTLMFRHLRDDATAVLGGGTAAFMRLANHHEAEQAASYLGRQHASSSPPTPSPRAVARPAPRAAATATGPATPAARPGPAAGRAAGSSAAAPTLAAGPGPPATARPAPGPRPGRRPTAPPGAMPRRGSAPTSTGSSRPFCRTYPSTRSCSLTAPAQPCSCAQSNATRRSSASRARAPGHCRTQAASSTPASLPRLSPRPGP
jgi:hypothetical protein